MVLITLYCSPTSQGHSHLLCWQWAFFPLHSWKVFSIFVFLIQSGEIKDRPKELHFSLYPSHLYALPGCCRRWSFCPPGAVACAMEHSPCTRDSSSCYILTRTMNNLGALEHYYYIHFVDEETKVLRHLVMTKVTQLLWARAHTLIFWLRKLVGTSLIHRFHPSSPVGAEGETAPTNTEPTRASREQHGPSSRWDVCSWWGMRPQQGQACDRRNTQVTKHILPELSS